MNYPKVHTKNPSDWENGPTEYSSTIAFNMKLTPPDTPDDETSRDPLELNCVQKPKIQSFLVWCSLLIYGHT